MVGAIHTVAGINAACGYLQLSAAGDARGVRLLSIRFLGQQRCLELLCEFENVGIVRALRIRILSAGAYSIAPHRVYRCRPCETMGSAEFRG